MYVCEDKSKRKALLHFYTINTFWLMREITSVPRQRPLSGLWSKVGATAIKSCQRSLVDGLMWNSLLFKSMIKFHSIDKFIGKWSIVIVEAPTWMWKHLDRVPAWLWEVFQKQVGWGTWLETPKYFMLAKAFGVDHPKVAFWKLVKLVAQTVQHPTLFDKTTWSYGTS